MMKLLKNEEAQAIARVWNMAIASLSPDMFCNLEDALKWLCTNRHIDNETLAFYHRRLSGKENHSSDCAISQAPVFIPGPCDCSE